MYLIVAVVAAILFFLGLYIQSVRSYAALLKTVQPLIEGKFKSSFLYSSITLLGAYKGRQVVCGLEQLKGKGDALFVKIKLHEVSGESAPKASTPNDKIVLSGGWLNPLFYFSRENFNRKALSESLDRLSTMCDNLERQIRVANTMSSGSRIEYKVDKKMD